MLRLGPQMLRRVGPPALARATCHGGLSTEGEAPSSKGPMALSSAGAPLRTSMCLPAGLIDWRISLPLQADRPI